MSLITESTGQEGQAENSTVQDAGAAAAVETPPTNVIDSDKQAEFGFAEGEEWKNELPEDIKFDPILKSIKDQAALAKSYVHAQRKIGQKGIIKPGEGATEQEIADYYTQLGLPERDKYDVGYDVPEENKELLNHVIDTAHKSGALPSQLKEIMEVYDSKIQEMQQAGEQAKTQQEEQRLEEWKKGLGTKFDSTLAGAQRAARQFMSEEQLKWAEESGVGNDPMFVEILHKVSQGMGEDKFTEEARAQFGMTKEEALSKAQKIQADPAYHQVGHPKQKLLVEEVNKLFELAYK